MLWTLATGELYQSCEKVEREGRGRDRGRGTGRVRDIRPINDVDYVKIMWNSAIFMGHFL